MGLKYVIWDWNGTLLDDTQAALDTLNLMIVERGGKPIGMEFYREHFRFPVRPFYDEIGIHAQDEAEWDHIAREYHELYARQPKGLNCEAVAALERVRAAGVRQCILSALRQDLLERDLAETGVAGFFELVYGTDNLDGASKLGRARELAARLGTSDAVMIGDALHDREVAAAMGIGCVLCAQGGHSAPRLRAVAPTGETLLAAVELAIGGGIGKKGMKR